jgi:hypothetical protein
MILPVYPCTSREGLYHDITRNATGNNLQLGLSKSVLYLVQGCTDPDRQWPGSLFYIVAPNNCGPLMWDPEFEDGF